MSNVIGISVFAKAPPNFHPEMEVSGCFCSFQNTILLLKRCPNKSQGTRWSIPAGKMEKNEKAQDTAIRELYEETKLDVSEGIEWIGALYVTLKHVKYIFHMYHKNFLQSPIIDLNCEEHTDCAWMTVDDGLKLPLVYAGKEALQVYKKTLSKKL